MECARLLIRGRGGGEDKREMEEEENKTGVGAWRGGLEEKVSERTVEGKRGWRRF